VNSKPGVMPQLCHSQSEFPFQHHWHTWRAMVQQRRLDHWLTKDTHGTTANSHNWPLIAVPWSSTAFYPLWDC